MYLHHIWKYTCKIIYYFYLRNFDLVPKYLYIKFCKQVLFSIYNSF